MDVSWSRPYVMFADMFTCPVAYLGYTHTLILLKKKKTNSLREGKNLTIISCKRKLDIMLVTFQFLF